MGATEISTEEIDRVVVELGTLGEGVQVGQCTTVFPQCRGAAAQLRMSLLRLEECIVGGNASATAGVRQAIARLEEDLAQVLLHARWSDNYDLYQ
jgi:hypothetical protein